MKIYTTYFANIRKLSSNIVPISVARYTPRWYFGASCVMLAPTEWMVNTWKNDVGHLRYKQEDYRADYYSNVLNRLNPGDVVTWLNVITGGKDAALCCFERPEEFCHRHLLADWLRKAGFECSEI